MSRRFDVASNYISLRLRSRFDKTDFLTEVTPNSIGSKPTDRDAVGDKGDKYIFVTDEGSLQIFRQDKLAWTKISQTVDRWETQTDQIVYDHAVSLCFMHAKGRGPET